MATAGSVAIPVALIQLLTPTLSPSHGQSDKIQYLNVNASNIYHVAHYAMRIHPPTSDRRSQAGSRDAVISFSAGKVGDESLLLPKASAVANSNLELEGKLGNGP